MNISDVKIGDKVKVARFGVFPNWSQDWAEKAGLSLGQVVTVAGIYPAEDETDTDALRLEDVYFFLPIEHFELADKPEENPTGEVNAEPAN